MLKPAKCSRARIHNSEPEGDILLFLTGEEEIEQACRGGLSSVWLFRLAEGYVVAIPSTAQRSLSFSLVLAIPRQSEPRSAAEGELQEPGEWRAGPALITSPPEGKDCSAQLSSFQVSVPLYSSLPPLQQQRIFEPPPGPRFPGGPPGRRTPFGKHETMKWDRFR